jgi:hypothetical protein
MQRRLEPLHRQIRRILNYPEQAAGDCGQADGKESTP